MIVYYLARSLIITIIVETIIALLFGVRDKGDLIIILLVNIFTNPIVNIISFTVNVSFGLVVKRIVLLIMEILAIIVEGFIYKKSLMYKKIKPYYFSLLLNLCSYGIGLIINSMF